MPVSAGGDAQRIATNFGAIADALAGAPVKRALGRGGMAGKRAALDVANDATNGSGRLSHMGRRGVKLGAGFDAQGNTRIAFTLRPTGAWKLLERGARPHIEPKRANRVVVVDGQPYSRVQHPGTSGRHAITDAKRRLADVVPPETMNAIMKEVIRAWR